MGRTDSTEHGAVPLRESVYLQVWENTENTRTTALIDKLKAYRKREAAGMETLCPRPGEP